MRSFHYRLVTMITCARFPLAIVIAMAIAYRQLPLAAACIILALVTDWIDGPLARRWKVESDFGKDVLEPLADTAVLVGIIVGLYFYDLLPLWLLLVTGMLHLTIDHVLKPRVWWRNRIILVQAILMEGAVLLAATLFLAQLHWLASVAFLLALPAITYLKRSRIRNFAHWCWYSNHS